MMIKERKQQQQQQQQWINVRQNKVCMIYVNVCNSGFDVSI